VSPLTRIAQLCCSIDQRVQSPTRNNIRDVDTARHSASFNPRSTATELLSFQAEFNFRFRSHAHPTPLRQLYLQRGRRRSALTTHRSVDAAKRYLLPSSSSAAAFDFYFRSLMAARSLPGGFHFRYPSGSRAIPTIRPGGIARPRALRVVPRFPVFLPTGSGIFGTPATGQQVSNQFNAAFGHFRPPLFSMYSGNSASANRIWLSGMGFSPLSRDHVVKGAEIVTSPQGCGTDGYNQQPLLFAETHPHQLVYDRYHGRQTFPVSCSSTLRHINSGGLYSH